jgi:uncharacterized phiE125 gp8 family phage protein
MAATLITPPATFPVTLAEAKAQCRVLHTDEDDFITALIAAATGHVEKSCGLGLIAQTWRLSLDGFADTIQLPLAPIQSVTSVEYLDEAGDLQTASASLYTVDTTDVPGRIVLNDGEDWPETQVVINAVRVTYVVGYATPPAPIKQAILLLIGHWFENREGVVTGTITAELPLAVEALLANYRVYGFG